MRSTPLQPACLINSFFVRAWHEFVGKIGALYSHRFKTIGLRVDALIAHLCGAVRMIETQHKWAKPSITNIEAGV